MRRVDRLSVSDRQQRHQRILIMIPSENGLSCISSCVIAWWRRDQIDNADSILSFFQRTPLPVLFSDKHKQVVDALLLKVFHEREQVSIISEAIQRASSLCLSLSPTGTCHYDCTWHVASPLISLSIRSTRTSEHFLFVRATFVTLTKVERDFSLSLSLFADDVFVLSYFLPSMSTSLRVTFVC